MAGSKEIRNKIKSVQSTRKITKAMEMVAASKMKKAQDRMRAARPYVERAFAIAMHIAKANTEYKHPFLVKRDPVKRVGAIVITTDKGLCGGLNTNVLRLATQRFREWRANNVEVDFVAIGNKGLGFLNRMGANVVSSVVQLGDRPRLERLVGAVKVLMDEYLAGGVDEIHIFSTTFVNTMRQDPRQIRIVPIPEEYRTATGELRTNEISDHAWDYIYEPDARELLDGMMRRYLEAVIFQMVNENMASEQSARMVAMKAASDNAGKIISELQLIYNKTRQAAITKELSEIVGGAAAV
ncbi:MAG TPA: F0F1 ATP synthase subunit gamma [Casimicrobiaceae bacterium]|jgi:F-type H+-transporting ATPase subunit gamma|nr:F0F1 ATP synthase subunit gamma [Casimicrobiaceae bacterium]HWC44646.1 F0F1 ATP synthase subunit gamma [Casimicrobiaceae bacterium]